HFCLLFLLYLESFLLCTFSLHVALPILDLPAVAAQCKESVGRLEWSGRCRIARNPSSSLRCSSNGFSLACSLLSRRLLAASISRSEEHTSELQSRENIVCRLLLVKKKT